MPQPQFPAMIPPKLPSLKCLAVRGGFTLLEVLAALALSAILAVLVASLMRSGLQESKLAQQPRIPTAESWLLREQMEADIANARAYAIRPDAIVLGGFLSRDAETGDLTQHLTIVTYRLAKKGKLVVLERVETAPAGRTGSSGFSEVVWDGVARIRALPCAEVLSGSLPIMPELSQLGLQPLTHGMFVQLFDEKGVIILEIPGTMLPTGLGNNQPPNANN